MRKSSKWLLVIALGIIIHAVGLVGKAVVCTGGRVTCKFFPWGSLSQVEALQYSSRALTVAFILVVALAVTLFDRPDSRE